MRRGGSESNLDVVDSVGDGGVGLDFTKGALGIDSLQQKILKVRPTDGGMRLKSRSVRLFTRNPIQLPDRTLRNQGFHVWGHRPP